MRRPLYPFHLEPPRGDFVAYLQQLERQSGHVDMMRMPKLDWESLKRSPSFSDVAVPQSSRLDALTDVTLASKSSPPTPPATPHPHAWGRAPQSSSKHTSVMEELKRATPSPSPTKARSKGPSNPFGIDPGLLIFVGVALIMFSVFGAVVLIGEEITDPNLFTPCVFGVFIGAFLVWSQRGADE